LRFDDIGYQGLSLRSNERVQATVSETSSELEICAEVFGRDLLPIFEQQEQVSTPQMDGRGRTMEFMNASGVSSMLWAGRYT
jgi:hypothetical protein